MIPPVLETERLILRPMRLSDAEAHYRYFNDYNVTRYLARSLPWPYPAEGSIYFLTRYTKPEETNYFWAITVKGRGDLSDEFVGVIELRPHETKGQRGFWLAHAFQGQGLMTEAANATTDFWFNVLKKPFLSMSNAAVNVASRRIKEKAGARLIRIEPGEYVDPAFSETEIWEITADEWQNRQK